RDPELRTEPVLPSTLPRTQIHHPSLDSGAGTRWHGLGAAGAVLQTLFAFGRVTLNPVMHALPRDSHLLRHVRFRAPLVHNPLNDGPSAVKGQPRVTVGHESLRV